MVSEKITPIDFTTIEEYVTVIKNHYKPFDKTGKLDVALLVIKLGGEVKASQGSVLLDIRDNSDFTVYTSKPEKPSLDKFGIAKAIGHYFLHYLHFERDTDEKTKVAVFSSYSGNNTRASLEANHFASLLLSSK